MLNNISGVVRDILLINILVYFGTLFLGEPGAELSNSLFYEKNLELLDWGKYQLAVFYPSSPFFRPYQLVSHFFMHADFGHLFFNMIALVFFGPILEMRLGAKRFFIFYIVAGMGAVTLYMLTRYIEFNYFEAALAIRNTPMLGASGAVFAILAGFATLFPEQKIHLLFPPISLKAKYFISIYIVIELFMGLGPFQTGVAHFAHLGGALIGFLLIKFWKIG